MTRPTGAEIEAIKLMAIDALRVLREHTVQADPKVLEALCTVESFVEMSLRVMAKTNPSKLREAARLLEIQARMDGGRIQES